MKTQKINYSQLAERVGSMVLLNSIPEVDTEWYEGATNYIPTNCDGDEDYDNGDYPEIYQWYAINEAGYLFLQEHTREIIGYSELLGVYYWGITHYGTAWSHVSVDIHADADGYMPEFK